MLWHLGAKMAHKSAKTRQDTHEMIFEVQFMLLRCVFDIGASKTQCFTRVRNRNHAFSYVFLISWDSASFVVGLVLVCGLAICGFLCFCKNIENHETCNFLVSVIHFHTAQISHFCC